LTFSDVRKINTVFTIEWDVNFEYTIANDLIVYCLTNTNCIDFCFRSLEQLIRRASIATNLRFSSLRGRRGPDGLKPGGIFCRYGQHQPLRSSC
jgi:hypothetical protein